MRYVPSPTKTRILFDKGEARVYNLLEWTRGVILDPITEIAANDTRKWEFLDYNCFLGKMAVNNPLIHDADLAALLTPIAISGPRFAPLQWKYPYFQWRYCLIHNLYVLIRQCYIVTKKRM